MRRTIQLFSVLGLLTALTISGCEEEGPMERAGKRLDRAGERIRYGDETSVEKAERKLEEAIEELEREYEKALEKLED